MAAAPGTLDIERAAVDGATVEPLAPPPKSRPNRSLGDSIARGALANLGAQPFTWGSSLLMAIALPHFLGADGLGQYTTAISLTTLAATALGLGITEYLVRRVAQHPENVSHDTVVAVILQTLAALLGAVVLALAVPIVAPALVEYRLLLVVLVGMIITPVLGTLLNSLRARELHARYAWVNAAGVVLAAVGGLLVLAAGADVLGYAVALVLIAFVNVAIAWKFARLRRPPLAIGRTVAAQAHTFIRGGFPFLTWNITLSVYGGLDRLLLAAFVPAAEVGWYAAAYRIIGMAVFIPTVLTSPLFPVLSRSAHEPRALRQAIASAIRVALLLTVPLCAGTVVVASVVPTLLAWPGDFAEAVPLMRILSLHIPFVAIDMVLGTVIMAIGLEGRWVRVGIFAAVFNCALNLAAIPLTQSLWGNGAVGASVATVLTELVMFVGALLLIPRSLLEARILSDAARVGLAGIATAVVGLVLLPFAVAAAIIASGMTYLVVTLATGTLTVGELKYLYRRLPFHPGA